MRLKSYYLPITLFFICLSVISYGQKKPDVVRLKNGSQIKGLIINVSDTSKIGIKTVGGNIWVFDKAEIDTIARKSIDNRQNYKRDNKFESSLELGFHSINNDTNVGFYFSSGAFINNNKVFAGAGIGYEQYEWLLIPFYADFRWYILPSYKTPFIATKIGYAFAFEKEYIEFENTIQKNGGVIYELLGGFRYNYRESMAFQIALGYHYQKAVKNSTTYQPYKTIYRSQYFYNRIALHVGFIF